MPPKGVTVWRYVVNPYVSLRWKDPNTHKLLSIQEHIYLWQLTNGPVPEGFVVHHKDGNTLNNDLKNLEALPSAKHARLHHYKGCDNTAYRTAWSKAWQRAHPERVKASKHAYYMRHREKLIGKSRLHGRDYYIRNRERIIEKSRLYRQRAKTPRAVQD